MDEEKESETDTPTSDNGDLSWDIPRSVFGTESLRA